jgi:hypothetical protein
MDSDILRRIAEIIDPMTWKAWEVDAEIQTRRRVSEAKASEILKLLCPSAND